MAFPPGDCERLEGIVTTESGSTRPFTGTLDLLRILEELEPPADPAGPTRWVP